MSGTLANGAKGRIFSEGKMFIFAKGSFMGAHMEQSLRALQYMREHHAGQFRNDGQSYAVHPLMMVCYALSLGGPAITDEVCATILLHDVCEETTTTVEELPFNEVVRNGVKRMTLTRFPDETKYEQKRRCMRGLLESKEATIGKGIDRYCNLMTMPGVFSDDKVRKNVVETDLLLLPVLKDAKRKWPELSGILHVLRMNIRSVNDTQALRLGVKLTDSEFVNAPDAVDYSYLVTGV